MPPSLPSILQVKHCASGTSYFFDGTWPARCPLCGVSWPSRPFESFDAEFAAVEQQTFLLQSTQDRQVTPLETDGLDWDGGALADILEKHSATAAARSTSSASSFAAISAPSPAQYVEDDGSFFSDTTEHGSMRTLQWNGVVFKCFPCPLVSSWEAPRSLLIKTTNGDFINNYSQNALLHVGLSSSDGSRVYNFDERGCCADGTGWDRCVAIPLSSFEFTDAEWDSELAAHSAKTRDSPMWIYHPLKLNCYDYALDFINSRNVSDRRVQLDKYNFVEKFISGPLSLGVLFVTLARVLLASGVKAVPSPTATQACDACNRRNLDKTDVVHCLECDDFDLCFSCYKAQRSCGNHTPAHDVVVPESFAGGRLKETREGTRTLLAPQQ